MPTPVPQTPQTPPATPDATAQQLTDVVTRLRRALRTSIRTEYPWEALPMAQIELMQSLSDRSPARVGDLAARQRLSTSTVSGLIGQLMTAGLVVRGTHADDRRVAVVELTEAGRRQLADWQAAHQRRIGAALERLELPEQDAVAAALPALAKLVEYLFAGSGLGNEPAAEGGGAGGGAAGSESAAGGSGD
ncbi:transcriptional regulator, MarR family [Catenulispora acidiphila DSM 44928]|uniref:Transcriptional regulator, MarR family n=1 Tax=Catenulispora acidiphila (strain DSM 44928 / JCM 14897 / NBRC 102108 / NRRL B-24433 / ID139908) TaxID=479433 RepID=C7QGI6_CATAD|nr:MarR family transcriptional regulator [Catenulispora acidiphila]ACU74866.1 transcriptional regulator, MarR family [Catenulispora acidiphila DSM 44928]